MCYFRLVLATNICYCLLLFVDVRTQGMYQLLDSGFIGLIFSCFSEDSYKVCSVNIISEVTLWKCTWVTFSEFQIGRIQVIAFQSSDGKQSHLSRPISLSHVNKSSVIDLESSLSSSENVAVRSGSGKIESPEQDTGDSRMAGGIKVQIFFIKVEVTVWWLIHKGST